jgi:hypothetical protein
MAGLRAVSDAAECRQLAGAKLRERGTAPMRPDLVVVTVDHEHGTADAPCDIGQRGARDPGSELAEDERVGIGLHAPADRVLDLLGRVRLVEALPEEVLEEARIVAPPVVAVVLRPTFVGRQLLLERREDRCPFRVHRPDRDSWCDEDHSRDALGVLRRQQEPTLRTE